MKLLAKEENRLKIKKMDVIDGTPLLDIKPYIPRFDDRKKEQTVRFLKKY